MSQGLIWTQALILLTEALLLGAFAVRALVGPFAEGRVTRSALGALALLLPIWLWVQASEMVGSAVGLSGLWLVLSETRVGHMALVRAALWLIVAVSPRRVAGPVAGLAVAAHGLAGHAAASGDIMLLGAAMAHRLVASVWIGGLLPLFLALRNGDAPAVAQRFTRLGLICVAVLGVTALIQAQSQLGGLPGLFGTFYGWAILAKLAGLCLLVSLALRNRLVLTPRLVGQPRAMDRSLLCEIGVGLAVLVTASLLTGLPPGAHAQPDWPFAWRISLSALSDPELRAEVRGGLGLVLLAAVLVAAATYQTRLRWGAVVAAWVAVWFAVPHLSLLTLPAVPTQYWEMPEDADPGEGARVYAETCIGCHKADRRGIDLASDLAAPHFWEHADGELFWSVSHGIRRPDGGLAMPGFAGRLTEMERWAVIAWLHLSNPAPGARVAGHHHTN